MVGICIRFRWNVLYWFSNIIFSPPCIFIYPRLYIYIFPEETNPKCCCCYFLLFLLLLSSTFVRSKIPETEDKIVFCLFYFSGTRAQPLPKNIIINNNIFFYSDGERAVGMLGVEPSITISTNIWCVRFLLRRKINGGAVIIIILHTTSYHIWWILIDLWSP